MESSHRTHSADSSDTVSVEITSFAARAAEIKAIRSQVFHHEQHIDLALDFDGLDAAAVQVIAYAQGLPLGTARVRRLAKIAKIERVAVLSSHRNQGVGTAILQAILALLRQEPPEAVILNAQRASEPFYRRLGFVPQGKVFLEAGIEHIQMCWEPGKDDGLKDRET
ncbi:MAG: GNAT family N-acetyltransferase [Thermosynechococcaceae cyanobacterium]